MFNNFDLYGHTVLLTRAGSRAYGMHTASSDLDLKGVALPPEAYTLGLLNFHQADKAEHFADPRIRAHLSDEERSIAESTKVEGSIYSLKKFMLLAQQANPNILDVLYCREQDVLMAREVGEILRANRGLFLTAKAYWTFSRYAVAQMKRIQTHRRWLMTPPKEAPTRTGFGLTEAFPSKTVEIAEALITKMVNSWEFDLSLIDDEAARIEVMDQFRDKMTEIVSGVLVDARVEVTDGLREEMKALVVKAEMNWPRYMSPVPGFIEGEMERVIAAASTNDADLEYTKWRSAMRGLGLDDNLMTVLEKERKFKAAKEDWRKFTKWQRDRNPDRAALEAKYGYDTKHGAHLVRLMRMCGEVLDTGIVHVWRGNIDADELKAIRGGEWSYDRLLEFSIDNDKKLKAKYDAGNYNLPHHPNPVAISDLCVQLISGELKKSWS
jgi:uncharacterized protein